MKSDLLLEVLSHHGQTLKEDGVESVTVETPAGPTTFLSDHIAYFGAVQIGVVTYKKAGKIKKLVMGSHGIVEIFKNHITIMVHTAEKAENIDIERAKRDKKDAIEAIRKGLDKTEGGFDVHLALELANNRIALGEEVENRSTST